MIFVAAHLALVLAHVVQFVDQADAPQPPPLCQQIAQEQKVE